MVHLVVREQRRVLMLEAVADLDVGVDVAQVAIPNGAGGAEQVRLEQLAADDAGVAHCRRRVAEQLAQLRDRLRVRPQVGEHLAQARQLGLGSVERPVFALGVVPAMLPAAQVPGDELQRRGPVPEPPQRLVGAQAAPPANARAAGTRKRTSPGSSA